MASRFPRRRRDRPAPEPDMGAADEAVHLDGDEHAWWAQRDVEGVWMSHDRSPLTEPAPEQDILAEHFGADWRTSFGFDAPASAPPPGPSQTDDPADDPADDVPLDTSDPYAVLHVDATATWEEIVDAHRRMARRHHPDRLVGRSEAEIADGEDRIRTINIAYQELRVRRGR